MISIRNQVNELERCHEARQLALDSYVDALRNLARYTVDLDSAFTEPHRRYLNTLAEEVAGGRPEVLVESRSTLRGLLRTFKDKAAEYLSSLQNQLSGSAQALQDLLDSLAQNDGDHDTRLRSSLNRLREIARSTAARALAPAVLSTVDSIEQDLETSRKEHQLTVAQFQMEIRVLHKRIDDLETAAAVDRLTKLFNRAEMEERIRAQQSGKYCLLLIRAIGFRFAEAHFSTEVMAELAGAFAKRLRGSLPPNAVIGRWSEEEFVAILYSEKAETMNSAKWISEHLSGAYACLMAGKTVRPGLQLTVAALDSSGDTAERILERVGEFLTATQAITARP